MGKDFIVEGPGFVTLLQILFIGLKLTGYIDWSWTTVFLPYIISFGLVLVILLIVFLVIILGALFSD